jgi:hypothetical protein
MSALTGEATGLTDYVSDTMSNATHSASDADVALVTTKWGHMQALMNQVELELVN